MTIQQYYNTIKKKIEVGDFKRLTSKDPKLAPSKEECSKNAHLEAIHYLMYEFMKDRNDKRMFFVFDYVCQPKGVNKGDIDIDFTKWKIEDFLKEIMKLKN
ncbi:MAG: hypothetical protein HPY57_15925 [Ignavibacteria bacterium]|nr:hypothetical protein [Ignavibacteria bacterium]